jgi:hypothetical protein
LPRQSSDRRQHLGVEGIFAELPAPLMNAAENLVEE